MAIYNGPSPQARAAIPYAPAAPIQAHPPPHAPLLPIVSLVMSLMALLGVVALAVFGPAMSDATGDNSLGSTAPLTGQIATGAGVLAGSALSENLHKVIIDDGGDVSELRCPDTATVRQGAVTVCHGTISGEAWAIIVFFEDTQGNFTALPT